MNGFPHTTQIAMHAHNESMWCVQTRLEERGRLNRTYKSLLCKHIKLIHIGARALVHFRCIYSVLYMSTCNHSDWWVHALAWVQAKLA